MPHKKRALTGRVGIVPVGLAIAVALTLQAPAATTLDTAEAAPTHTHSDLDELFGPSIELVGDETNGNNARTGGRTVTHYAGATLIRAPRTTSRAPTARLFYTGTHATEPTMAISSKGSLFFTGGQPNEPLCICPTPTVMRSKDRGRSWQKATHGTHPTTQDPYTYLDKRTDRLFTVDFVGCHQLSYSDDAGESWTTSAPAGCGYNTDHQTLFAGPPPEGGQQPIGYPNVVYLCSIGGGALAQMGSATVCSKSLDGGLTFVPSGNPAFEPTPDWVTTFGNCDGPTGHGFVDSRGTVYLPRGYCGQPFLAISKDEGATWTRVQVAKLGMPTGPRGSMWTTYPDHEAGVAVDDNGVIYFGWVAKDRLPYLTMSQDGGKSWSKPLMVGPPGVNETMLPALDIGDSGGVAMTYMGTTNSPGKPWDETKYKKTKWTAYITMTANALARDPVFYSAPVSSPDNHLVKGTCGPIRCQAEFDFIDVQVGPDGSPWAIAIDGCPDRGPCVPLGEAIVATLADGPSLGRGVYREANN